MNLFGLESRHIDLLKAIVIKPLLPTSTKLWVFGSRARGDYQKFSDLDLLVSGHVSPQLISSIREALEESSLPIKVDLVCEEELAESYRDGVMRDRVEFSL